MHENFINILLSNNQEKTSPTGGLLVLFNKKDLLFYYISDLVGVLRLVSLVGRILLYGPLKVNVSFVAKLFRDLLPSLVFLTFVASKF